MTREQILEWCEERATLPFSYDDGGYTSTSSYHVREWPNGDRYEYHSTQDRNTNIETITVKISSDTQGLLYMAFVRHGLQHFYYGLVHR